MQNAMRLATVVAMMLLDGCTQMAWVNPGKSESDFNIDKYQCMQEAANTYPAQIANVPISGGYSQPAITNCSTYGMGNMSCVTTPGSYTPPTTVALDANTRNRNELFNACMVSKGWRLVKKDEVSEQPASSSHVSNDANQISRGWKEANEACNSSDECKGAMHCSNGYCAPPKKKYFKQAGEACADSDDCIFGQGLVCTKGICKTPW